MRTFAKVTFIQFSKDASALIPENIEQAYNDISLPKRATRYSAGYDFFSPIDFTLNPGEEIKVPTGIRVLMPEDEWLGLYIRSGHGFKYGVRLKNSVAVIDADYSNAANEGHIWIAIYNGGDKVFAVKKGEAFAQGVFQKYLLVDGDEPASEERVGGIGSTSQG